MHVVYSIATIAVINKQSNRVMLPCSLRPQKPLPFQGDGTNLRMPLGKASLARSDDPPCTPCKEPKSNLGNCVSQHDRKKLDSTFPCLVRRVN